MSAAATEAARQLDEAIAEARDFGIKVDVVDDLTAELTGPVEDGDRVRCVVGRFLDDGVFVVRLAGEQAPELALSALQVAIRRLLDFEHQQWFVSWDDDHVPVALTYLCDVRGLPMELLPDVQRLMAVSA
jgi:hypothetical protein